MADWENLPHELLITIATKLTNLAANIRFTGACRSWRHAAIEDRYRLIGRQQIPGLILPPRRQDDNPCLGTRKFIPVTEIINHHHHHHHQKKDNSNDDNDGLFLPWRLAERSLCLGWFRGWMLVLHYNSKLTLLNPVTGSEFALPEAKNSIKHLEFLLWGFRRSRRVTIWAHSNLVPDWYVFIVLPLENFLVYCRVGDAEWRVLEFPEYQLGKQFVVDALCCGQEDGDYQVYVMITTGELFCCDFSEGKKKKKRIVAVGNRVDGFTWGNLVEVEGEIVMVNGNRVPDESDGRFYSRTTRFDVYRLDREGKRWIEIKELGDGDGGGEFAVFIGFGQPFPVRADSELGIRGNCIYFLSMEENRCNGKVWCDIGVFDLKRSKIEFFHVDSELEMPCAGKPVRLPIPIAPVPW